MSQPSQSALKLNISTRLLKHWRKPLKALAALSVAALLFLAGMGMEQRSMSSPALFVGQSIATGADRAVPAPPPSPPATSLVSYRGNGLVDGPREVKARRPSTSFDPHQPMLARRAGLSIAVKDLFEARRILEAKLFTRGGYIASLQAAERRNAARELQAVLRVPAAELQALLADLKSLGRVESESSSAEEVTQQYVDLTARLSNARNTEQRLIDVLRNRTGKVADILEVEQEIARVREEIERMDAERKHMEGRVSHASVELRIFEDYRAELTLTPPSPTRQLWNSLVDGLKRAAGGVFELANFTLQYLPALLLWALILFWPVRAAVRRIRAAQAVVEKAA